MAFLFLFVLILWLLAFAAAIAVAASLVAILLLAVLVSQSRIPCATLGRHGRGLLTACNACCQGPGRRPRLCSSSSSCSCCCCCSHTLPKAKRIAAQTFPVGGERVRVVSLGIFVCIPLFAVSVLLSSIPLLASTGQAYACRLGIDPQERVAALVRGTGQQHRRLEALGEPRL